MFKNITLNFYFGRYAQTKKAGGTGFYICYVIN